MARRSDTPPRGKKKLTATKQQKEIRTAKLTKRKSPGPSKREHTMPETKQETPLKLEKKRPGRPRSEDSNIIRVYIDPQHNQLFEDVYKSEGKTASAFTRELLDREIERRSRLGGREALEQLGSYIAYRTKDKYNESEVKENRALVDSVLYEVSEMIRRFYKVLDKPTKEAS